MPEDLSSFVLGSLKADAEVFLGERVEGAIITVPAYFNDKQRKATRRAGELAGLRVEGLLNEPTAAALSHGLNDRDRETAFLIFDLGGGTFDVSIVEMFEGVIEVRASTGDNRLGGEDFNALLAAHMRNRFAADWGAAADDPEIVAKVGVAAERARRLLTETDTADMSVVWQGHEYVSTIDGSQFESMATPLLARLKEPVLRALRDTGIANADIQDIILVGGATRMPIVRRAVTRMFGRFPRTDINPDEAVALGAAVQAALKARHADLREVVMTDVAPYTLGVGVAETGANGSVRNGIFAPIIERNTTIPASRVRTFSNLTEDQREVVMDVYQGEARNVAENIKLGSVTIPIPRGRRGEVAIDCRFTCDASGIIEVDVVVPSTREHRRLTIVDDDEIGRQPLEGRRRELDELKIHPRDGTANKAALSRAERCFEESLGDLREHVNQLIHRFEAALETQDPRVADVARAQLTTALDGIEGRTFL